MFDLIRKKTTKREFLKIFGLSSTSLLASGFLADELLAKVQEKSPDLIPAVVMIKPNVILSAQGRIFSSVVVFPEGYELADAEVSSVMCEGAHVEKYAMVPDSSTMVFLFNSDRLRDDIPHNHSVTFTVHGNLSDGTIFKGSDTVSFLNTDQLFIYHTSTRKRKACSACKNHALNRIYTSRQMTDDDRAHPGCDCRIVVEQIGWQDYAKAFWHSSRGGMAVYDRRWGWPPPSPAGLDLKYTSAVEEHLRRG